MAGAAAELPFVGYRLSIGRRAPVRRPTFETELLAVAKVDTLRSRFHGKKIF